ncbi:MAG: hypothetical protein EP326_05415 [Deltaproteobacteria bacterium]|jgi:hypothetical protein|nr:MAG: hypothetical protein EP326_05415 [Deltaproteobacteria bacterium]TNF28394.1 MAG: hypothetical protein EP319_09095 [Deltaproteobacteria bacterium]
MENLERDYQKGKEVLEDLRYLGDSSLAPLISRAHHHLFEIRRKAEDNLKDPGLYGNVNDLLNHHVENMIHLYFKKNPNLSTINLNLESGNWSLYDWNRFIELIPTILAVSSQFNFSNSVAFYQVGKNFYMTGAISLESDIAEKRRSIYGLFRKLVSKRVLMTYELNNSVEEDLVLCTLKFNLSHRNDVVYYVPGGNGAILDLAFSNLFSDYIVDDYSSLHKLKHTTLRIHPNFEVERMDGIPDNLFNENPECELLHFPFIFHPVSLIIPNQGYLKGLDDYYEDNEVPGTEFNQGKNMEVQSLSRPFHYIDFFDLIVK